MSRILDSLLSPAQRADCEANDDNMEQGAPCGRCEWCDASLPPIPVIPAHLRPMESRTLTLRCTLLALAFGMLAGQMVAPTSCPPHGKLQLDRSHVHTVPGTPMQRKPQRMEV